MNHEMQTFDHIADLGEIITVACSPNAELIAANDADGHVTTFTLGASEPLPIRFDLPDAMAVLLHADGRRVISYVRDPRPRLRVFDAHTGAHISTFVLDDGFDDDDVEGFTFDSEYGPAEGFYLVVSMLEAERSRTRHWPFIVANPVETAWQPTLGLEADCWMATIYPTRLGRLALHPNGRLLAILDRATMVVDIVDGSISMSTQRSLDGSILDGEGTHGVDFDSCGDLVIAATAISGNPFVEFERLSPSGATASIARSSGQTWPAWGESAACAVTLYTPTSCPPCERIPEAALFVVFRQETIEVWSRDGLVRGVPRRPGATYVPSFDPSGHCTDPRVAILSPDSLDVIDLRDGRVTGGPIVDDAGHRITLAEIGWVGFSPTGTHVLIWVEGRRLLSRERGGRRWTTLALPDDRRVREFALAVAHVVVADDAGGLWSGALVGSGDDAASADSRIELRRAVEQRPDDEAALLVYADALIAAGDARGELIVLDHRGESQAASKLIERNARAGGRWLGTLAELAREQVQHRWRHGFIRELRVTFAIRDLARVLAFIGSDEARLLERLELRIMHQRAASERAEVYEKLDAWLTAARHPPRLQTIVLGEPGEHALSSSLAAMLAARLARAGDHGL